MKNLLNRFDSHLRGLREEWVHILAFGFICMLGLIDLMTGFEISFSFFYLLPISIITWYASLRAGLAYTVFSLFIWYFSNIFAGQSFSNDWVWVWNFCIRLIVFMFFAFVLDELNNNLQRERTIANTDFLTGIQNKREFYRITEWELRNAARHNNPVSIAYIDIDDFKMVNDRFGHDAGDQLLVLTAESARNSLRKTDIIARLGGDEFAVLLPNTKNKEARIVVQKIKDSIQNDFKKMKTPASCSIGLVTFNKIPASVKELIARADAIMYKGKTRGKNRIISASVK